MTLKERMLMAARGELPEVLPYAPRFDLWYNANSYQGTLPRQHRERTADEIARAEGWALHKVIPELLKVKRHEENLHRGLGVYSLKENGYRIQLSSQIEVKVKQDGDLKRVEYHTPLGVVSVTEAITEEMRKAGASITWLQERAIKKVEDYRVLSFIFDNMTVVPDYARYAAWQAEIGDDGVACMMGTFSASGIHHIMRDLLEATDFYYEYKDHEREMRRLAESIERVYEQILRIVADSPAEVVLWGANYDDTITYTPFFAKEIKPYLQKVSRVLEEKGKLLISHCDGENRGLMDLIRDSGIHIAEAVCPFPMTKVKIEEYYQRWSPRLTIFGGIPQSLLLTETASEEDFQSYIDHFFKAVAPGSRIIVGIADTTPPNAVFDRLVRLGERIAKEGRLPLKGGGLRPLPETAVAAPARVEAGAATAAEFLTIKNDVLKGDRLGIKAHIREMLDQGFNAVDILNKGMIAAMEEIGGKFTTGEVFIPEVLLSARAMNEALTVLEPYLAEKAEVKGKVLIGTVLGDLHDIGKNMVVTMLRGVGLEIRDLGVNLTVDSFVKEVAQYQPDVLGLSALLTSTMPQMHQVIDALKAKGLRDQVKVIVGGAPVNEKFARDIGADGYAADAGDAVTLVKRLLQ
ncbi:MAG: B12-binding domain-containing protein [Desulfobaccales bacterium]